MHMTLKGELNDMRHSLPINLKKYDAVGAGTKYSNEQRSLQLYK